ALAGTPFNPATLGNVAPFDPSQITTGQALMGQGLNIPTYAQEFANVGNNVMGDMAPIMALGLGATQAAQPIWNLGLGAMGQAQPFIDLGASAMGRAQPFIDLGASMQGATQPIINYGMGTQQRVQPIINAGMTAGNWDPSQVQAIMSPYNQAVIDA